MSNFLRVGIITPTIGNEHLLACVESVAAQTYKNVIHYLVVDGRQHLEKVQQLVGSERKNIEIIVLPEATGTNKYFGHRIYGAMPYLLNTDYIAYLDEDNWFDANHLEALMHLVVEHNLDWAYALRRIVTQEGALICEDNCESLGLWGAWCNGQNMVDTSCYLIRRTIAVEASSIWHRQGYSNTSCDPDKALCRWLVSHKLRGFTSGIHSVNYRLGSSADSALIDYFLDGNKMMDAMYKFFPWKNSQLEIIHDIIDYRRIITSQEKETFPSLKWSGKAIVL